MGVEPSDVLKGENHPAWVVTIIPRISLVRCRGHPRTWVHGSLLKQAPWDINRNWLVVRPPLWKIYDFVNWDDEIPNINGKMPKMATKPPTRESLVVLFFSTWLPSSSFSSLSSSSASSSSAYSSSPPSSFSSSSLYISCLPIRIRLQTPVPVEMSCMHTNGWRCKTWGQSC